MEILDLQVYQAPNIFSLREPVVKIKVSLGELAEVPTKDIKDLNRQIIELFPGLYDHKCSKGYVGGFLERLEEGTYLAHVTEHLCLEMQRMLGHDMKFGKARQVDGDIYNIIYACAHPEIGKDCGLFIINAVNNLIDGNQLQFHEEVNALKKSCTKYEQGPSTQAIVSAAKERGIPVSEVGDSGLIRLGTGKYQKYMSATLHEGTSVIAADIACDKNLTKQILKEANIPVPEGKVCSSMEEALSYVKEIAYPVVVKPKSGNQGKHVFIDIRSEEELKMAALQIFAYDKEMVIENLVRGRDYRLLVVNGNVVAAAERIPAHVIGDGIHNIQELVEMVNQDKSRGEDHEKPLTKIKMDEQATYMVNKQGYNLSTIPKAGQRVWLRQTANLSTGGAARDCTEEVHPINRGIAELAAKAVGLDIAGIDMIIPDITKPMEKDFGAVVEVNAAPGIRMHLYPSQGEKRDVISPIMDMIYPKGKPHSIPIIAITGTNGKTTTTRMIRRIFMEYGMHVGMTTTHGIYIDEKCIEEGDTTGPMSANRVLNDRSVDVAVLETARGGIVRQGLAYEKADVAVFTNLTEDHLGIDEINTLEELLHAKSLVIEAVKENGTCVLNADDPWFVKIKERAKSKIFLCSLDENNPHVAEHVTKGGSAVYIKQNDIYVYEKGFTRRILGVGEIPATLDGALQHNIYNSMAAIAAALGAGVPVNVIRKALKTFSCDAAVNPGRFNLYDLERFKVVLDYGHNLDGYSRTIEGLKSLSHKRLVGVIGVPGDRKDEDVLRIGELAGRSFDRLIIKEDRELRGRDPLEVANLLQKGAIQSGMDKQHIEIIPEETEALENAMSKACKGDLICVFFEKLEPLVEVVNAFKSKDCEDSPSVLKLMFA